MSKITTGTLEPGIGEDSTIKVAGDLAVSGNAAVTENLAVTGNAEVQGNISIDGTMEQAALPMFACRAWVNFDGTRNVDDTGASSDGNPVFIRAAGNVSTVTRVAVGRYTVNFTTPMPDAAFATVCLCNVESSDIKVPQTADGGGATTTSVQVVFYRVGNTSGGGTLRAAEHATVAVFR